MHAAAWPGRLLFIHNHSPLLGGLFKLENAMTLAFYKLTFPVNDSKLGIGIAPGVLFFLQQYPN